jgi:hypothetical protein
MLKLNFSGFTFTRRNNNPPAAAVRPLQAQVTLAQRQARVALAGAASGSVSEASLVSFRWACVKSIEVSV